MTEVEVLYFFFWEPNISANFTSLNLFCLHFLRGPLEMHSGTHPHL